MKRKIFRAPFVLKATDDGGQGTGQFTAVFATFNVKDHDGDVTIPGAFHEGQEVFIEPWNHGWDLPVGKGVIHQNETEAWVEGQFFTDTLGGKEHYIVVKNAGTLQEWSYTFDILKNSNGQYSGDQVRFLEDMDTVGVSPVTRGAGIDTRTTHIKNKPQGGDGESDAREDAGDATPVKRRIDTLLIEAEIIEIEAEMPLNFLQEA